MSFEDYKNSTTSEKTTLAWIHGRERILAGWDSSAAPIYTIRTTFFVSMVYEDSVELSRASSQALQANEFFFDPTSYILYIRPAAGPSYSFISVKYRFFFSDNPVNLPYDLASGSDVPYLPRIHVTSKFSQEIDSDDLTGISLAGTGNIQLYSNDSFFDETYDKIYWEGNEAHIYAFGGGESQLIYRGIITSKSFNSRYVKFELKDFIEKLRDAIPLPTFSSDDGDIPDGLYGKPKRRLYGRVGSVRTVGLDQVLDGYLLTGTVSGTESTTTITGSGTSFLDELSPNDEIYYISNGENVNLTVDLIASDTSLTVSSDLDESISGETIYVVPAIPWRKKNRERFIAHHELKQPSTTVTEATQLNRVKVADIEGFEADDFIYVDSEKVKIRRISGLEIVLNTNLNSVPSVGVTVLKSAVQKAYIEDKELILTRDFTLVNTSTLSKITLDDEAELNLAPQKVVNVNMTMTNGSRSVDGTGFENFIRPRDWVKLSGTGTYYEVLQVESDILLKLRVAYAGATDTAIYNHKRPNYIDDNTIIHVDCLGKMDSSDNWIKTGSQVIKDLLIEAGLEDELNTTSFDESEIQSCYLPSLAIPLKYGDKAPTVKEIINVVNKSIFGSVYYDNSYQIAHKTLSPEKPTTITTITDSDIESFAVESSGDNMVKTVTVNYRHLDYNKETKEEESSLTLSAENEVISKGSTISREEVVDVYLYRYGDAKIIMDRIKLLRESSNSVTTIKASIKFIDFSIGDAVYFELDRLFERFGTSDKNKIGVITRISKAGDKTELKITDLGGLYNKVFTIAANSTNDYGDSTIFERATSGFITDTNELINDDIKTYRMNLIG